MSNDICFALFHVYQCILIFFCDVRCITVGHPQGQTQDYPLSAPANNNPEKYTPSSYHGVGRACVLVSNFIRFSTTNSCHD